MRNSIFLLFSIFLIVSCKNKSSENITNEENEKTTIQNSFPADLVKVFDAHGSLNKWKEMKGLSYEIVKEGGNEKQLIDLATRNERIEASGFKTGYNGTDYWVEADTSYKGNPKFYHNLMFYFYAMPFVLADEGIIYSDAEPLIFEDTSYPGIRISYNQGVGESPEDEYFIHYNPDTYQMEWLGYTVTFFSGEKSKKVKWIRYNDWDSHNDLLLPNSMTWYKIEDGVLKDPRDPTKFVNIRLSKEQPSPEKFDKTQKAIIVE